MKIFLSSTFADLLTERRAVEAVIERMALTYVGMEHFGSFSKTPLQKCLDAVGASDIVILVLGRRYGSTARDQLVSFTEAELREALRLSKPVLAYVSAVSKVPNQAPTDRRLEALKAEISHILGVSQFNSPQDLAWKVATDLHRELPAPPASDAARRLAQQVDDLVEIFVQRAREIRRTLSAHYKHTNVERFLDRFDELHAEHLTYLRKGQFVVAHEVVNRIHELSFRLESDQFWASRPHEPFVMYKIDQDAFTRGPLIQKYAKDLRVVGADRFDTRSPRVSAEQKYLAVLQQRRNEA